MTATAVDEAMSIYDTLFPIQGGWFQELQGCKILKLFPCQFRGIGARYRCARLDTSDLDTSDLNDAFGEMPYPYLTSNLIDWNNSMVELLQYGPPD